MTRKLDSQEPLLNTVARKLGHAAGTLANLTHKLTTEQTAGELHPASKPESVNSRPASARSLSPRSANSGTLEQKDSPASAPQKRALKKRQGARKKRAAASAAASRRGSIRTKSSSRRKS